MEASNDTKLDPRSYLGAAAKQRDEKVGELSLELPIPTWGQKLMWGFKVVDRKWLEEYAQPGTKRTLETDIDLLVTASDAFWFYDPDRKIEGQRLGPDNKGRKRDEYVRVEDEGGQPVGPDQDLAEALGLQIDDGRNAPPPSTQLILYLFKSNGSAIGAFAVRLAMWTQNTDMDVTKDILGE